MEANKTPYRLTASRYEMRTPSLQLSVVQKLMPLLQPHNHTCVGILWTTKHSMLISHITFLFSESAKTHLVHHPNNDTSRRKRTYQKLKPVPAFEAHNRVVTTEVWSDAQEKSRDVGWVGETIKCLSSWWGAFVYGLKPLARRKDDVKTPHAWGS